MSRNRVDEGEGEVKVKVRVTRRMDYAD